jgi:enamine deaminase RidA (YjgF/YER057c/UK114 family)
MEKTILKPSSIHQPYSNYSHGITVDGARRIVFCAGQVAGDAEANLVGEGDFDAQADQVMLNLKAVLSEAGANLEDVVKVTIYVVRQEDAEKGRNLLRNNFGDDPPASTLCVLQGLADPRFLVEVEAIAVLG